MEKAWHKLIINLDLSEYELLVSEAKRVRMPVETYIKRAAVGTAKNAAPHSTYTMHKLTAIYHEAMNRGHEWTEEELRERGLPFYWSRPWMLAQLYQGMTYADIALKYGYKVTTVRQHARRYHTIVLENRISQHDREEAKKKAEAGASKLELAQALGVSLGTVRVMLRSERDDTRRVKEKIRAAGPWPATVKDIALRLYGGRRSTAARWLGDCRLSGHLVRVGRGVYDIPDRTSG